MTELGTYFGKRAVALGAIVALLLAGFAALAQQQAAKATITSSTLTVDVKNVSPPAGGKIIYKLTWTEDGTATDYQVRVTNLGNLDGCTNASLSVTGIAAASISTCSTVTLPFGGGTYIYWNVTDNTDTGSITATVVLQVSAGASVGASIQPTFTLLQTVGSNTYSLSATAPARAVGSATVTPTATEAVAGQQVTFTFTLPPGWTCGNDGTEDPTRACVAADVTSGLSSPVVSVSDTNLYAPATVTVTGQPSGVGLNTVSLDVQYHGDADNAGDNNAIATDVSATLRVWIGLNGTLPTPTFAGGSASYQVEIANLTGQDASAGTVAVTVTFPPEFTSATAPSISGWSCSASGLVVSCTSSGTTTINNGDTVTLSGFAGVLSPNTGSSSRSITVQAQVTFTNLISGPVTKTATRTDTQDKAGSVSVTANPTVIPSAGSSVVQWTVSVSNDTGSSVAAANVSFQFKAPPGTLATNVVPASGWSCTVADAETVNCSRTASLATGSTSVGTFVTQVPANASATIVTRTATATLGLTVGSTTYTLQGSANALHPGTGQPNVTYNLVFGWNLITWGGQTTAVNGPNGLGSIVANVSAVYTFDAAAQTWLAWFPGGGPANTLTTLQHGTAYFVYVTNPAGVTLTVPAGP
ncbi:hypothetical protein HRbin29_02137 [bacterium HR29]|nr:hypothetical protein HRbin29_02137 [bacterium HR29]